MATTVHGLKACDASRRAVKALEAEGPVVLRDLRASPPDREEVEGWLAVAGDRLLNRRSTTWRQLSEAERGAPVIDLLLAHPTLIKRPVVERPDGTITVG